MNHADLVQLLRDHAEECEATARERAENIEGMHYMNTYDWSYAVAFRRAADALEKETVELSRQLMEVNKALGLDRDNEDNKLRITTALRLRSTVETAGPRCPDCGLLLDPPGHDLHCPRRGVKASPSLCDCGAEQRRQQGSPAQCYSFCASKK